MSTGTQERPSAVPPAVSVDELKRAWAAVQAGQFRAGTRTPTAGGGTASAAASAAWTPAAGERVLPILGCSGSTGATTVALAVASAAIRAAAPRSRVVECSSVTASGLAAASTAELGLHSSGWRQGNRDQVLLERASEVLLRVDEVPTPCPTAVGDQFTVLDIGWEIGQLLATPSWLNDTVRSAAALVVVTTATVPGFRRLEGALELLGADRTVVAVLGPRRKKWANSVEHSAGPRTRQLLGGSRAIEIPEDRGLAVNGLDSTPLPACLLEAAARLLEQTKNPNASA